MYEAIEGPRQSLLESLGCKDPCLSNISIDFTASAFEILVGETVGLINLTTGATDFVWKINGVDFSTDFNTSYTFNDVGVDQISLEATNSDPNCSGKLTVNITVKCDVEAGFSTNLTELAIGETLTCTSTSAAATDYHWQINGVDVGSNGDVLDYTFSNEGLYTVLLEASNSICMDNYSVLIRVFDDDPCADSITASYFNFETIPSGTFYNRRAIAHPDGGVYTYLYRSPIGLLARFDKQGNQLWQKQVDVPYNGIEDAVVLDDESIVFSNDHEHKLLKFNQDGTLDWVKKVVWPSGVGIPTELGTIGTGDGIIAWSLRSFSNATYIHLAKILNDGTMAWHKSHRINQSMRLYHLVNNQLKMDKGGFVFAGYDGQQNYQPHHGGFIIKFDSDGNLLFCKRYRMPGNDNVSFWDAEMANNGEFVVSGLVDVSLDSFNLMVMKADANGNPIWVNKMTEAVEPSSGFFFHKIKEKPTGGFLQRIATPTSGFEVASWSDDGQLEFAERVVDIGYVDDLIEHPNKLSALIVASNTARDFHIVDIQADGHLEGCINTISGQPATTPISFNVIDIDFEDLGGTAVLEDVSLTTSTFPNEMVQEPICEIELPCDEVCDNGLDDDEDGYVDCYDEDCDCFNGADCNALNGLSKTISAKLDWRSEVEQVAGSASISIANLNPQQDSLPELIMAEGILGFPSILFTTKLLFIKGDGSNKDNPAELNVGSLQFGYEMPVVGDVDGNGVPELAIIDGFNNIRVYTNFDYNNDPVMELMAFSSNVTQRNNDQLAMADFNSDGIAEIYAGNHIFQFDFSNPNSVQLNRVLVGSGNSGQNAGWTSQPLAVDILSVADCGGDPDCEGLELVAGTHIYSVDLDALDGDGVEMKIQRDLNVMTGGNFDDGFTQVADVNLDGILDIVCNSEIDGDPGLYIWDKNGLHFSHKFFLSTIEISGLTIANVYDDRLDGYLQDFPEIVAVERNQLTCYNFHLFQDSPTSPFWWQVDYKDNSRDSSPSAFDLNGDGYSEILVRDEIEFRILYGGPTPFPQGVDSDRNWFKIEGISSGTGEEYPSVADIDNDGEAEIVFSAKNGPHEIPNHQGHVWVVGSDEFPWVGARPFMNQHNYIGVNINDDLTIPLHQQLHHLELPGLGSGKRPFNTAHSQIPLLNSNFDPFIPVPDAVVQVDSSQCEMDSLRLWLTVCNQGSNELRDSLPLSFYISDPTSGNALLLKTVLTNSALPIDSCLSFSVKILAAFNTPIFILANDNGTLPTPFDLSADFPNTNVVECNYLNNVTQFNFDYQTTDLDLGPDQAICNSSVFTFDAGGGFVKYQWQDGTDLPIFTAHLPGVYWVDVWDACGFKQTDTVRIELDQAASIDLGPDQTLCGGESVDLSVNGFPTVHWWPADGLSCTDCPVTTSTTNNSITYYATASDGFCFSTDSIKITVAPSPSITLDAVHGDCFNGASISVSSDDGSTLDYKWENGATTETIQPTQSGTYLVTATNSAGCSVIDSVEVLVTGGVEFSSSTTPIICHDDTTASIQLDLSGGFSPFVFDWSNGAVEEDLTNLPAGDYSVIITDANDCTATQNFSFTNPPELLIDPASADISCNNDPGFIELASSGGVTPLSISWSNDETADSITITEPATYIATVTDANGCAITSVFEIKMDEPLLISLFLTSLKCYGDTDGEGSVAPINGQSPYTYSWANGHTDSLLTGIGTELHAVTVTDAMGCKENVAFNLIEPDSLILATSVIPIGCNGETTGSVAVGAMGGEPDYHYLWNTGDNTPTVDGLPQGVYFVTVTDELGCKDSTSIEIGTAPPLEVTATASTDTLCPNETADLFASANGGSVPYTYLWNGTEADSFWLNVPIGTYDLLVTDANGCTQTQTIEIGGSSSSVIVDVAIQPATGMNNADGAIFINNVMGGTAPYTYEWSNGDTTMSIDSLLPSIYSLLVTDAMGCAVVTQLEVTIMVGTDELDNARFEVSLFPNPIGEMGMGTLSVESSIGQQIEVKLFDVTGRVLQKEQWRYSGSTQLFNLNAPEIAGVYILQVNGVYLKWVVTGK